MPRTLDLIETIYRQAEIRRAESPQGAATPGVFAPIPKAAKTTETLASSGQMQDQAALNGIRELHGFEVVYSAPAEMRMPERVALYGLLFGLQPKNVLEIGSFRGGSTAIMCGAQTIPGTGRSPASTRRRKSTRNCGVACSIVAGCSSARRLTFCRP